MSSAAEKTVIRNRTVPTELRIADWPLRDDPGRSSFIVVLLLAVSAAAGLACRQPVMSIVIFILLGLLVPKLWLPTTYELSSKGVVYSWLGRKRRIAWSEFARYELGPEGILLAAEPPSVPGGALRTLFIRWSGRPEELVAMVDFHLPTEPAASGGSTRSFARPGAHPTSPETFA